MFDFGIGEIGLLIVLAVVIFGPEKLPELARKAARVVNYLRMIGNDARGQLRRELGPEFDDFDLADLNPKRFVQRHLLSGDEVADLRQMRDEALEAGTLVRSTVEGARDDASGAITSAAAGTAGGVAADAGAGAAPSASVGVPFDPEAT